MIYVGLTGLLIAMVVFSIKFINSFVEFKDERGIDSIKITFNQFISLYSIAPNKWRLKSSYACYQFERIDFCSYVDYKKYIHWKERLDDHKRKQSIDENTALMIKCWQKDIDNYKSKHEKETMDKLKSLYKE